MVRALSQRKSLHILISPDLFHQRRCKLTTGCSYDIMLLHLTQDFSHFYILRGLYASAWQSKGTHINNPYSMEADCSLLTIQLVPGEDRSKLSNEIDESFLTSRWHFTWVYVYIRQSHHVTMRFFRNLDRQFWLVCSNYRGITILSLKKWDSKYKHHEELGHQGRTKDRVPAPPNWEALAEVVWVSGQDPIRCHTEVRHKLDQ